MATAANKTRLSFDSYLEWEAKQAERHELVDGEVFALTGGSTIHGAAGLALLALLRTHLRNSRCRVFWPHVKLKIGEDVFYPDVKVSCSPADLVNVQFISSPILIAEIL